MPALGADLRRVTFCSPTASADGAGGATRGWTNVFTASAGFSSISARELTRAGTLGDNEVAELAIRESADALAIRGDWSALIGGQRWAITAIQRRTGSAPHLLRIIIEKGDAVVP
jgi:head-tail adaptor